MATSGDMQLQLILALTDKISSGLDRPIAKLRTLDTKVAETYKVISNLQRLMGQPVNTGGIDSYLNKVKQLDKVSGASRRIENFNKKLSAIGDVKASPGLDNLLNKVDRLGSARGGYGDNYRGHHSERHSTMERLERGRDIMAAPREIGDVWRRQADSLRPYIDATLDLTRAEEKLRALGLGEADNKTAFDAVRKNVAAMKGLSLAQTTKELTDLHTATGSLGHAIESLPVASKYHFAFSAIYGDKFSNEQIEEQIQNAFKYLEMTGKVSKGREAMEHSLNTLTQISTATGGRVNPEEMLLMARRGGASVRGLSDEGLRHLIAPMQELGGSGLGTSMMSVYGTLVQGVMKQSAATEFQRLGFLDKSKIEFNKSGIIKKVLPGGNVLGDMFMDDPLKATDALMAGMRTKGITSEKDIRKELGVLFQNRTANKLVDTLITQRPLVAKDAQNSLQSEGYDALTKRAQDSPLGKIKQYEAAMVDFKANAGLPMIEVATKLSGALIPVANFFAGHGNVTLYAAGLLVAGKAGVGLLETLVTLNQVGLLSRPISEAARLEQSITGAGARTGGLGSKLAGLGGIVGGLTPLAVGLGLSAAIGLVIEMKTELNEIDKKNAELQQKIKGNYDALIHPGSKVFTGALPQTDADSIARQKITDLQKNGELQQAFSPWSKENWWTTLIHPSEYTHGSVASLFGTAFSDHPNDKSGYNPDAASKLIFDSAQIFGDMKVLTSFLVQARQGGLGINKNQEGQFEKSIEKVFPNEYKVASKDAAEYLNQLDQKTQDTAKKLVDLSESASPLPTKLLNFGSALQTASAQASGFQMPTMPSFFGSNYPAPKPDQPLSPRPQFILPGAKPPSILNNFFHKTSALDADGTRRPKTDSVAYLQPLREKTSLHTFQRPRALDADAVRRPAYSMAAFHPDTGKLSRVQTIAFTRPLDADAVRRPAYTKAVEKHSHVTREITNNLIKSETIAYFKPPRENTAVDSVPQSKALDAGNNTTPFVMPQSLRKVSDDAPRPGMASVPLARPLDADPANPLTQGFNALQLATAKANSTPAHMRTAAIDVNSSRLSFAATQARVATRQGKQIGDVHIHIDGNAPAAKDPQLLAASIREELSKLSQQVGGVTKEMRDDNLLERRINFMLQRGRERA
jgi:hypothetical protein